MPSYISLLLIVILLWSYSFYYAFKGKEVTVVCKNPSFSISIILFGIIGIALLFISSDILGILSCIACFFAGIFYAQIPSGFSNEAIYLKGKKYRFKDIEDMQIKSDDKNVYLLFQVNKVFRILSDDINEKIKLERLYEDFQKGVIG